MSTTEKSGEAEERGHDKTPRSAQAPLPARSLSRGALASSHGSSVVAHTDSTASGGVVSPESERSSSKETSRKKITRRTVQGAEANRRQQAIQEREDTLSEGESEKAANGEEYTDDSGSWSRDRTPSSYSVESESDASETSDGEVTGPPHLRCHRCQQVMEFDPGSRFVQVCFLRLLTLAPWLLFVCLSGVPSACRIFPNRQ